ncbi:hypothetical protein DM01DRAFT_1339446 [Hesseltinella vesiculosa]|uniref:Uncharacterized protein n=1 Tax=Hesseltinella vesiculosa TaxID=101127 RepID=A0A1X2G755_9FUNG|nr:hypothetical protein DM01DRAFT_1339446 [Hesseltinella vesiculosa]
MDEKYVGLQNTMYEKRHILEEILKCQQLRSVYQHVELLPLESFEASAPDRYRQGNDNPHTLMIHRLLFEKDERTSLQEQEERLALVRQELIKENRKGQDKLDRYDKLLDDFVLATAPLEDALKDDQTKPEMETDDPAAQPDAVMMDVDTEEA